MKAVPATGQIERYFQLAAEQAKQATCYRARCGTVIIKDGEVIGAGFNAPPGQDEAQRKCEQEFSHEVKPNYDTTCCVHAEWSAILNALRDAGSKVTGSTLYFMRVDDGGNFTGGGKPFCTVCSRLALEAGISEFVLWHAGEARFFATDEYNLASYLPYEPRNPVVEAIEGLRAAIARGERPSVTIDFDQLERESDEDDEAFASNAAARWDD